MAVQKVKVRSSGHGGKPRASGRLWWAGESGPTCEDRDWSGQGQVFLPPPPHRVALHRPGSPVLATLTPPASGLPDSGLQLEGHSAAGGGGDPGRGASGAWGQRTAARLPSRERFLFHI